MLSVINPATEEILQQLQEDDASAIARKAAAARSAQPGWAAVPLHERTAIVRRFGALLVEHRERLARLLTSEMGKPVRQSRNELTAMQGRIDFFLERTASVVAAQGEGAGGAERITYEPLGVVANISAWNYPYFVSSNVFLPALLTGNAVLYKPSEHAALSGLAMAELLHESGVPPDAFVPVIGAGAAGAALLEADIDAIFFTGSYATGRRIAERAGARMLRMQLELGGKDPAYVCDDVDVAATAAALADGAFYNAGQSCCAVERIYVHESLARPFIEAFVAVVRGFAMGDPTDERTYIGPLARRAQLEVLEDQVADALRLGARLEVGGGRCQGGGEDSSSRQPCSRGPTTA